MTQRERLASGGATGTASRPGLGLPAHAEPPGASPAPSWDELYARMTPAQREEAVALARAQGLVYAQQLPAPVNGSTAAPARSASRLQQLLAGLVEDLQPVPLLPLTVCDAALTDEQREAVARALSTPDLCLIAGAAGTGKSRVVAEIVLQAASRGERVLALSATAPATDRLLELLASADAAYPIRCVEPGEALDQLPGESRAATFAARLGQATVEPLERARREASECEAVLRSLEARQPAWALLRGLAAQARSAGERLQALQHERARIAEQVSAEAQQGPALGAEHATLVAKRGTQRAAVMEREAELAERQSRAAQELAALAPRLEELQPLVEAKHAGQWWKLAWWRVTLRAGVPAEYARLQEHRQKVEADLAALAEEARQLDRDRQQTEERFAAELRGLIEAEVRRRQDLLAAKEASLQDEARCVRQQWDSALAPILEDDARPLGLAIESFEAAEQQWQQELERCQERQAWIAEWIRGLEASSAAAPERVAGYANVVCGTLGAWRVDPHFGETAKPKRAFDRTIVQEAELLTRADLLYLEPQAQCCVLVAGEESDLSSLAQSPRTGLAAIGLFSQLWQGLHLDPRRLPYEWSREQRRLVCRLRRLAPEQRGRLEREPVSDCPDVELRILHAPNAEPVLAEIAFPESFNIAQAKQYVFRELDELAVVPAGSGAWWREDDSGVVLEFRRPALRAEPVPIAPGVLEILDTAGEAPRTAQLVFERGQGWDRVRAEAFVTRHLGLHDLRRTTRLLSPRRSTPDLGLILADVLGRDDPEAALPPPAPGCANGCAVVVEFVSVARTNEATRSARPLANSRGGAGLELDLTDRRHRDRLPSELRPELPERGFVNYLEACSIIRMLEDWAADPARVAEASPLAVIALYPSQAFLLRRLAERSASLRQGTLRVEIGTPDAFRERGFSNVVVSLTRSHVHRAVAFGEGPRQLALALTRASRKLILFGDPGTLVRRGQWEGRLEHLNEADAAWERAWAERLVRYLEGTGRHQRLFHLREGSLT